MQVVVSFQGSKKMSSQATNILAGPRARARNDPAVLPHHQYHYRASGKGNRGSLRQPGSMHYGWQHAWQSVEPSVFAVVDRVTQKEPWWTVITCGHALGGALSTVAAEAFATRHPECAPFLPFFYGACSVVFP